MVGDTVCFEGDVDVRWVMKGELGVSWRGR